MVEDEASYVSRGGLKLAAALDAFGVDPTGLVCADLGCSTGGFTDCLLQRGARHVFAVDTAYGELAWKLRQDERVTVLERRNALHLDPWQEPPAAAFAGCSLVVVDLGWTRQERAVPAALRWLRPSDPEARIISLIKPHYESKGAALRGGRRGKLEDSAAETILADVLAAMPGLGVEPMHHVASPVRGGKGGNLEFLALLRRSGE